MVARDRDDVAPQPGDAGREEARLVGAARVAEVADEEHGLVARVVAQRVEGDAVVVQVGGEQRRAGVVDAARRRVGEQRREAAHGALHLARVPVARRARVRGGVQQLHELGAARVEGGVVEGTLVEAGPGLDERRRARDGGDREDGRRRADEDAPPPHAERRQPEPEHQRQQRCAAEGEAQRAQDGLLHGRAQSGLGRADRRPRAARGADDDVALDRPRLEVQPHRRAEGVEAHAPVGQRDIGLDLTVGGRGDADRDAAELRVVLAGLATRSPRAMPARARITASTGPRIQAATRRARRPRRVGGRLHTGSR